MKTLVRSFIAAFVLLFASLPLAAGAAGFELTAAGMADDAQWPADMAFAGQDAGKNPCGGTNRAPTLSWSGAPAAAQSFAILEVDPQGQGGLGVNHWVLYNIAPSATGITSAEIAAGKYTPGRGTNDLVGYRGPCPPKGDTPHHYIFTLMALDLAPSLPAGLDHDGVLAAVKGHVLGTSTAVFRFAR
jgi:Raf kinase inhibitor-like YbhB/YbcL family protein